MYEFTQIFSKIVIIAAIFLVALFMALRVWRADIDLREFINPSRVAKRSAEDSLAWLPMRNPDMLYQGGSVAAKVEGTNINEKEKEITFKKVDRALNLNLDKEFEFRGWRLRYKRFDFKGEIEGLTLEKNLSYGNMVCEIAGARGAL